VSIASPSGLDVRIINGPGVQVDRALLRELVAEWCESLSVTAQLDFCSDEVSLLQALHASGSAKELVAINPGSLSMSPSVASAVAAQHAPAVWIDMRDAMDAVASPRPVGTLQVRGRGVESYKWALRRLAQLAAWPPQVLAYGAEPDQIGDLRIPVDIHDPAPVAVFIHGGSWREAWERDTIEPLAIDLARRGYATWNVEYRRVGPSGGGWPTTCQDIAAALDYLRKLSSSHALDLDRVLVLGHSAGGHLALWAATRRGLDTEVAPRVAPVLVVSIAGIPDLVECARRGLGDGGNIAAGFMGGRRDERPDEYALASPAESLPLGIKQLLVQGLADEWPDLVDLNRMYHAKAQSAGDDVELLEVADANHFDVVDPESHAWERTLERITAAVGSDAR
jgi:acetyl esterase/lipase